MFLHGLQQVDQGQQVVLIIHQGFIHGLRYCFVCGKMYDGLYTWMVLKAVHYFAPVTQIELLKHGFTPGDHFDPFQHLNL